ncbi:MAG: carbamoyl-phosphate synthase domain-containing protein, partial [Gammaproteobacteria bacterium]
MKNAPSPAILAFSDGAVFSGESAGFGGTAVGEAVFNTAMSGYQEIISDPSYRRQIVNFTHPHIGNTGATPADDESPHNFAAGIIARKITAVPSNWRAKEPLGDYLRARKIPAICGIDTRAVTRKLRDGGAMSACIACGEDDKTRADAVAAAAAFGGLQGAMLAAEAGCGRGM